ncbi:hypothetical protein DYB37_006887 [Aphanomyces astaci]|uniref:Membrane-associated protein n=1 Tax=Aphanomyces astaci TaxID=112090 RepID=A0A397F3N4_APHAT|nr:hypothetical protein DYB30_003012 [Aphanomyces astaci]RHY90146.1 hypothetical protein DYB35_008820 [Aphanomyces astaci]RHZ09311.1 hypothetical protein DYB37_006887 [Aphanomyces astaci]RHZ12645.1 hypothetical protein DYB31_013018 [Aphanomyces astaci]RHZ40747.1 hypothetical protein DYB26_001070 [Aphanomyces astaci]
MHVHAAVVLVLLTALALPSTCQDSDSPTDTSSSTDASGFPDIVVFSTGRTSTSTTMRNETTTKPATAPAESTGYAAASVPNLAAEPKPSADSSTTTILLSIAVGLVASVGAAVVVVTRRRSAQLDNLDMLSSRKDLEVANIDQPDHYHNKDGCNDDLYSVHGMSTRGGSAYRAHGAFASKAMRSSNILGPFAHQPPSTHLPRTLDDGVSFADSSIINQTTTHATSLSVVDDADPPEDEVMCTMISVDSMVYLDTAHLLQSITSNIPLPSTIGSDTYIVGDDDEDEDHNMSEYVM